MTLPPGSIGGTEGFIQWLPWVPSPHRNFRLYHPFSSSLPSRGRWSFSSFLNFPCLSDGPSPHLYLRHYPPPTTHQLNDLIPSIIPDFFLLHLPLFYSIGPVPSVCKCAQIFLLKKIPVTTLSIPTLNFCTMGQEQKYEQVNIHRLFL